MEPLTSGDQTLLLKPLSNLWRAADEPRESEGAPSVTEGASGETFGGIPKDALISILVLIVVFVGHFISGNITPFDSKWTIHTAMSIVKDGDTDLDEYEAVIKANNYYGVYTIDGHLYEVYPVGVAAIATPFVLVFDQVLARTVGFDLEAYVEPRLDTGGIQVFIASFIVALTAVLIYLIARLFLGRGLAALTVFAFAFCTSSWSTASRALWAHGPTMLMLTAALYIILLARKRPYLIQFAALPLAFSYVVRPSNSISIVILTAYVLVCHRQYFLRYFMWAMVIAVPFLAYNVAVFDSLLPTYYRPSPDYSNFFEALAGNLISPGRGLFLFSPILLFSIVGLTLKLRSGQADRLDLALVGIILLHWMAFSSLPGWWAGWSFGPRYMSDMTPYLVYFLIPAVANVGDLKRLWPVRLGVWRKAAVAAAFYGLMAMSFFVHYRGATDWDVFRWNTDPVNIDQQPGRVWDWDDIQFLRGLQ